MKSVAHPELAGGTNGEHPAQRSPQRSEPAGVGTATGNRLAPEADPACDRLKELLVREAARLRQNTSGSMTVVVCVEEGLELLVHFAQCDTSFDVSARCEPGHAARLGAFWPRLQEALAARRIQLGVLRTRDAGRGSAPPPVSSMPEGRRDRNGTPPVRPDWETWA